MAGTRSKRKGQLTDTQIRERIGDMLAQPPKASHLTAAVFVVSFLAVTLRFAVPPGFTETGGRWGLVLWITSLVWTLIAAFGWKTLPLEELKRLSKEQQRRHLRSETIWFDFWKGGYAAIVSTSMLLLGLGMLSYLGPMAWVNGLAVGGYLLAFVLSFLQRQRILRVVVEGWSADTRWGRLMLRLAVIGPAAGASIGSGIGIILVRLHLLPESILITSAGLVGVLVADMMVPQVVQDFSVAWTHLQIRRTDMGQRARED
jgi:fumarate reductase subunit D